MLGHEQLQHGALHAGDWPIDYDLMVVPLLEEGIQVLIYVGLEDYCCNWLGNQRWLNVLPWSGSAAWRLAPTQTWTHNDTVVGSIKQLGPLSFVKVNGAVRGRPRSSSWAVPCCHSGMAAAVG